MVPCRITHPLITCGMASDQFGVRFCSTVTFLLGAHCNWALTSTFGLTPTAQGRCRPLPSSSTRGSVAWLLVVHHGSDRKCAAVHKRAQAVWHQHGHDWHRLHISCRGWLGGDVLEAVEQ